jgi:SAM-dependent methyltransferase
MARNRSDVPARIAWAVDLLDPAPGDRVLEIGCGPGVAVSPVCDRLDRGQITAIDRSAVAIERARRRNADHIEAGRAVLQQVDLGGFRARKRSFDKAFAVNVNLFWTTGAEKECEILADVLMPGGELRLVYEGPGHGGRDVGPDVARTLRRSGFATRTIRSPSGAMTCVTGRLDG